MGVPTIVCVEVERPSGRLRKWEDTLSAHVGQVYPGLREEEALRCLPMDERSFWGVSNMARSVRCSCANLRPPIIGSPAR
jgi:hypothetical protein